MPCAPTYMFNVAWFRSMYPSFDDATLFPDEILQSYWDTAGTIVTNTVYGFLAAQGGPIALNLLTAHLAAISMMIANGQDAVVLTGAGIDKINVSIEPPPLKTYFQYWLATTPYGQQLLAMMQVASTGGFYAPGGPGRAGFGVGTGRF